MFKNKKKLRYINFNNAGASKNPKFVVNRIKEYLDEEVLLGGYYAAEKNKKNIIKFYKNLSSLINCHESEISFVPSSTYGWNFFLDSINLEKGDNIIIFDNEYGNNFLSLLKKKDVEIRVSEIDKDGKICLSNLKKKIDKKTKIISMCHIASQSGNIQNAKEICKVSKKLNNQIIFLLDSCQSIGHIKIDVKEINCDVMVGSGRKYLRGPRGTGFIYIKDSIKKNIQPSIFDSRSCVLKKMNTILYKKNLFETFEFPPALIIGLSESLSYLNKLGIKNIEKKIKNLSIYFRNKIKNIKNIKVYENPLLLSGINTISIEKKSVEKIHSFLLKKKILTSISTTSTSYHYFKKMNLRKLLRISFHYYNTQKEIDYLVEVLNDLAKST
ncbi:MAG: putative cysteine desulfurase [Alphaproteobacteria bacterium MarineAlpha8_Bin1]|nr:MAG: putative cysteine desulfurase [Alphaproteobacteria bacterium MarineAlpha8_Bin1]